MKLHAKTYRLLDPRLWLLTKNEILENHFFDKTLSSNFFGAPEAGPPCSIFFQDYTAYTIPIFMGSSVRTRSGPMCLWNSSPMGNRRYPQPTHSLTSSGICFNRLWDFRIYPLLSGPTLCTSCTVMSGFVRIFVPSGILLYLYHPPPPLHDTNCT